MSNTSFRVIEWQRDSLTLLDQRLLPVQEVYVQCRSVHEVAAAIRTMVVRGAPAIGITAAYGIALAVRQATARGELLTLAFFEAIFEELAATRPTAVNLFWAIERLRTLATDTTNLVPSDRADEFERVACLIHDEDRQMCDEMGAWGASILPAGVRVLTHCNTGALATGGAGTALAVIRHAWQAGKLEMVLADETRPFLQGSRLTAWELDRDKIPVCVITDNMAADAMRRGLVDVVIVGADRITANGDVANKIGTYGLAVLCRAHNIPFYVAAPTSTIDLSMETGASIEIEQRPEREVTHVGTVRIVPENVPVLNPAFDVTPSEYVTAIITERGIARAPYTSSLSKS
jgi:methylthioribose-1-phosphate isomerase